MLQSITQNSENISLMQTSYKNKELEQKKPDIIASDTYKNILTEEKNIFFPLKPLNQYIENTKLKSKVNYIDNKYLDTIENFKKFTAFSRYIKIQNNFCSEINQLTKQCLPYLDNNIKNNFKNKMLELKNKIVDKHTYKASYWADTLELYCYVRPKVFTVNQMLTQIKSESAKSKLILTNNFSQIKSSIAEIINKNINIKIIGSLLNLLGHTLLIYIEGIDRLIYKNKHSLLESFAKDFNQQQINYGKIANTKSLQTLETSVFIKSAIDNLAVNKNIDNTLTIEIKNKIIENIMIVMSPINICMHIADNFNNFIYSLAQQHNCSKFLTGKDFTKNEIPEEFTKSIEVFIKYFNNLYYNNDNKIEIKDIIKQLEVENETTVYYDIINLKSKLHFYICRSLLAKDTYKSVANILDHDIIYDNSLTIVSIANCYFSVVYKNFIKTRQQQNIFNNIDSHITLQLQHITSSLIIDNNLTVATYRPLIIQALEQTNDAKQITAFFFNINIKILLQLPQNSDFLGYLAKIITKKIEKSLILKQQLINTISDDANIITPHNCISIANSYWIINTTLVEPILLKLATKKVNITAYINQLTIEDILNLTATNSLKNLFDLSDKKNLDTNYFYKMFNQLMQYGDSKAIIPLVHSGLLNCSFDNYNYLLLALARQEDLAGIELVFNSYDQLTNRNNFNLSLIDYKDKTLLMYLAQLGDDNLLKTLINQGVDVNQCNKNNSTALIFAARYGNDKCLTALIEHGAQLDTQLNDKSTALMLAIQNSHNKCAEILLKNKADTRIENDFGWTALILSVQYNNLVIMQMLLESDICDINKTANDGCTALMIAAFYGNDEALCMLINKGADLDMQSKEQWTALMYAAQDNQHNCLEMLIENCADMHKENHNGDTALKIAHFFKNKLCEKILVKKIYEAKKCPEKFCKVRQDK
jgi:ankyrin repeat protein